MAAKTDQSQLGARLASRSSATTVGLVDALRGKAGEDRLPLDALASDPANPEHRAIAAAELEELVTGIRTVGVEVPVIVQAAPDWIASNPDADPAFIGDREFVILDGHRRVAAARAAGLTHVPYQVRRGLVDARLFHLIANGHRLDFTPLEEARNLAGLVAKHGWSQRELAAMVGRTQGWISQRLGLLAYGPAAQEAMQDGLYSTSDARTAASVRGRATTPEEYAELDRLISLGRANKGGRMAPPPTLETGVLEARRNLALVASKAAAKEEAVARNALFVDDPRELIRGNKEERHRLTTKAEIAAAEKRGDLIVCPDANTFNPDPTKVTFYRISAPAATVKLTDEQKANEARNANKVRRGLLHKLAGGVPDHDRLVSLALHALLVGAGHGTDVNKLAGRLAVEVGAWDGDPKEGWPFGRFLAARSDRADQLYFAWLVQLARWELKVSPSYTTLDAEGLAYLDLLIEHAGYEPGEWERDRMAAARAATTQKEH